MGDQAPDILRAVTVVGSQPDGRRQVLIDKALSAQLTRTEFRVQLLAAGVFGALAEILLDSLHPPPADKHEVIGHA